MSTIRVNTIQNTSGVEVYTAKAWVNFNGTGTVAIRASGNVSSITDNGTGNYTVNFTTAFADANYAVSGSALWGVVGWYWSLYLRAINTGSCQVIVGDTANAYDSANVCVVIHR